MELTAVGDHELPFHTNACPLPGAFADTAFPCKATTVKAPEPVASPVWVAFGEMLFMVTVPVPEDIDIPVPATLEVTPVLENVFPVSVSPVPAL